MSKHNCNHCHWYWVGKCVHSGKHYGTDVSVEENQPKDCETFITEDDYQRNHGKPMTQGRCKELLNAIIDNLHVAENNITVIKYLLHIGFTEDELVHYFNYQRDDVQDALEEMDDYVNTLGFM